MKFNSFRLLAVGLAALLAGCASPTSSTPATVAVTGVTVTGSASVVVGSTITLTATVAPTDASNKAVTWSSDTVGVATVTASGVVTGVSAGTAVITATSSADATKKGSLTVSVVKPGLALYSETRTVASGVTFNDSQTSWGAAAVSHDENSTAVTPVEGTKSLKFTTAGGTWAGIFLSVPSGGLDVSAKTNLVFSINTSAIPSLADMGIKLETDGNAAANTQIQLATLTGVTSGAWTTYTIPLSSFSAVTLTKVNNLGFWNIKDSSGAYPAGSLYIDDIYFN